MGRRTAKYVEADAAGGALVPWREPAPVTSLLPVSVPPVEGTNGRHSHIGLRPPEGPPSELIAYSIALSRSEDDTFRPPGWSPDVRPSCEHSLHHTAIL